MTLAQNIQAARKRRGISMTELAKRVQVSRQHLYDITNGASDPAISVVARIAAELETTVDELLLDQSHVK